MNITMNQSRDGGPVTPPDNHTLSTAVATSARQERTYLAIGSSTTCISDAELQARIEECLQGLGAKSNVLVIPPDHSRSHSRAGTITHTIFRHYGAALRDILPALGTHEAMRDEKLDFMFPGIPHELFREHKWRDDVVTLGEISADAVVEITGGIYRKPWPVQLNRLILEGNHDVIFSVGQVVPHEVAGMANQAKNLFVGCGGKMAIDHSHFIGAVYGMERIMGRADNPVRQLFSTALRQYCSHLNIIFILTVVGAAKDGEPADARGLVTRGLYIGTGYDCFQQAANLSIEVNFQMLDRQPTRIVAYLDPDEYQSTWLANKGIYRTRMAIADGGELIVLAPGVKRFGEDIEVDKLIRKYGYRTTPEILAAVETNSDLGSSLSAAAHLIHGSSEGRFQITYAAGGLTRAEIEGVGYQFADANEMLKRYDPAALVDGWNSINGEEIYFVRHPALVLLAHKSRFGG